MDTNKMTFVCRTSRPEEIAHMLNGVGWYGDFYPEGDSVFWDAGCKPDSEDLAEVKGFATGAYTAIAEQAAQIADMRAALNRISAMARSGSTAYTLGDIADHALKVTA